MIIDSSLHQQLELRLVQTFHNGLHPGFCEHEGCVKTAVNFWATPDNEGVLLCAEHQPPKNA